MLTKDQSSRCMLIKIRHRDSFRLTIPIALFVFDEIIEALRDILEVIEDVISFKEGFYIGNAVGLIQEIFSELRRHKGFRLVEVEIEDFYVLIELK